MAIVFVSPKQRQRMFFTAILAITGLFVAAFSLVVFLAKPSASPDKVVLNRPKVDVNIAILDSERVKSFLQVEKMELSFRYSAKTKTGQKKTGILSASSEEEARQMLGKLGYLDISVKEATSGRLNPFTRYSEAEETALAAQEEANTAEELNSIPEETVEEPAAETDEVIEEEVIE